MDAFEIHTDWHKAMDHKPIQGSFTEMERDALYWEWFYIAHLRTTCANS